MKTKWLILSQTKMNYPHAKWRIFKTFEKVKKMSFSMQNLSQKYKKNQRASEVSIQSKVIDN